MTDLSFGLPPNVTGTVVTIGTFDGVHKGHRGVLSEISSRARPPGLASLLVTFEPHPMEIVNPQAAPPLLTLAEERREILAQCDLDYAVFLKFTASMSQQSPKEFISYLIEKFSMKELVMGHDHGLGRGRTGDVATLRELGSSLGFSVDIVNAVEEDGRPVSSTLIRREIAGGNLAAAEKQLGRRYSLTGMVVGGDGRGRTIGYPTLNIAMPDHRKLLPPDGVYAVIVESPLGSFAGMMHQGPRPTFDDDTRSVEVHLLDFNGDLYGARVKVSWVAYIRGVRRFASPEQLKAQLDNDLDDAENALTEYRSQASH